MLPHRARDVLHGRTIDRQQVVAGNEAAKVRRAGRVYAPDDNLPCEPCNRYARAWVSWINPCIRRVCSSVRVDPFGLLGEGFMEFCMLEY